MDKLPAIQFYPNDWRGDIGVQSLSYHDRGVWLEILFLMHSSEQRGLLLLNGKPMPKEVLARHLALDKQRLEQTLENFISYGVASIDEDTGALMNRRMVKDEYIRQVRKEAGAKGGNPNLLNQNSNQTPSKKQPLHLSSSTTTIKQEEKEKTTEAVVKKKTAATTAKMTDDEFLDTLQANIAYKHIDIRIQFEKAKIWAANHNRQPTRKFFIGWINRIEAPINTNGASNGKHSKLPTPAEVEQQRQEHRRSQNLDISQIRV